MNSPIDTFDGLDNRRTIVDLFVRFGRGHSFRDAGLKRAGFLKALLNLSTTGFANRAVEITPCTAPEAYHLFVGIVNALGVNIDWAAKILEDVVRQDEALRGNPQEPFVLPECGRVLAQETLKK